MSAWKTHDKLHALSTVTAAPPVAQLDRAPGFEPGCREFESLRAGHTKKRPLTGAFLFGGNLEVSNSRVQAETPQRPDQRGADKAHLFELGIQRKGPS